MGCSGRLAISIDNYIKRESHLMGGFSFTIGGQSPQYQLLFICRDNVYDNRTVIKTFLRQCVFKRRVVRVFAKA
jgi:hypothetical protein